MGDLDGYESDTENSGSVSSRDTDDMLDEHYGEIYTKSGRRSNEEEDGGIAGDALKTVREVAGDEWTVSGDSVQESKDGGLEEESKDGGLGEERKDGGLGEERKDGGLGEEDNKQVLDGRSEKQNKLVTNPQSPSLTHEYSSTLKEAQDLPISNKDHHHRDSSTSSPSPSPPEPSHKDHKPLSVTSDREPSMPGREGVEAATGKPSMPEREGEEEATGKPSMPEREGEEDATGKPSLPEREGEEDATGKPSMPEREGEEETTGKPSRPEGEGEEEATGKPSVPEREGEEDATGKQSVTEKLAASGEGELFSDRTQPQSGRPDLLSVDQEDEDWRSRSTSPLGNPFLDVEGTGGNGAHLKYREGEEVGEDNVPKFTLALISRRSRHRAGECVCVCAWGGGGGGG